MPPSICHFTGTASYINVRKGNLHNKVAVFLSVGCVPGAVTSTFLLVFIGKSPLLTISIAVLAMASGSTALKKRRY